jgi:multidrug/hemolysin transport system permease protein
MQNIAKDFSDKLHGQFHIFWTLTRRHLKCFFKNKMTFFFALLVPGISLIVYALFLRDLEVSAVAPMISKYFTSEADQLVISKQVGGIVDAWMLSGIIAISCISVSFNTCYIMISDKETGVNKDFHSSPISKTAITLSYFAFNFIVTFLINMILLAICLIYLQFASAFYFSILDYVSIVGTIIISIISATCFTILISSLINNGATFNSIIATSSAAIGFLIGAYMPIQMLPKYVQYICCFFPGTYSAGILRNLFLRGQIENLSNIIPTLQSATAEAKDLIPSLSAQFMNVDFFGTTLNSSYQILGLFLTSLVLVILNIIFTGYLQIRSLSESRKKPKKKPQN